MHSFGRPKQNKQQLISDTQWFTKRGLQTWEFVSLQTSGLEFHSNEVPLPRKAAQEAAKHDDESVCCQGMLVPVNAGIVLMRRGMSCMFNGVSLALCTFCNDRYGWQVCEYTVLLFTFVHDITYAYIYIYICN